MSEGIGSKRLVTGAHYGLRDWIAQRLTAALMALFTFLVLFQLIFLAARSATTCGPVSSVPNGCGH
jgi:succinate dehydrogenase hydrophobic anchor subunit